MDVFVYGTLTDPSIVERILDSYELGTRAELDGLSRADGEYPTLVPGGNCDGRILSTPDHGVLDRYEGVDRGLYVRRTLPLAGGATVECYIGDPAALGVADEWPGTGAFAARVERYLSENDVVVTTR